MALHDNILDTEFEEDRPLETFVAAGFWNRAGAVIVDGLIIGVFATLVTFNTRNEYLDLGLVIFAALVGLAYRPLMEFNYGATLGKMAIKICVINAQGQPMTVNQTLVRNSLYLISDALTLIISVYAFGALADAVGVRESLQNFSHVINVVIFISCLFVAFRKNGQALHDSLADTYVIMNPNR